MGIYKRIFNMYSPVYFKGYRTENSHIPVWRGRIPIDKTGTEIPGFWRNDLDSQKIVAWDNGIRDLKRGSAIGTINLVYIGNQLSIEPNIRLIINSIKIQSGK